MTYSSCYTSHINTFFFGGGFELAQKLVSPSLPLSCEFVSRKSERKDVLHHLLDRLILTAHQSAQQFGISGLAECKGGR